MGLYTELDAYLEKYPKDHIRNSFTTYITEESYHMRKRLLLFKVVVGEERNLPRDFVDKYLHLATEHAKNDSDLEYCKWNLYNAAIRKTDLDKLGPYLDVADWSYISRRKDLTLDFVNKHLDKISVDKITVNLGEEFISDHLSKMNEFSLYNMDLSQELILKTMEAHGCKLVNFIKSPHFDLEFVLKHKEKITCGEWGRIIEKLSPSYNQIMDILKMLEPKEENRERWNDLIRTCLDVKRLTLRQKKEIKWLGWL